MRWGLLSLYVSDAKFLRRRVAYALVEKAQAIGRVPQSAGDRVMCRREGEGKLDSTRSGAGWKYICEITERYANACEILV